VKEKKCKYCGKNYKPDRPLSQVCSFQCAYKLSAKRSLEKEEKNWKKEKAKLKEGLKKHSDYEKELQVEINHIVRLIDKGHKCMMCGNEMKKINACHYHSVGSNNSLRFHLHNNWSGCESCNSYKGGNINGYDVQLLKHFTETQWKFIKFEIVREFQYLKLSKEELIEKRKIAQIIVKSLEKIDLRYNTEERWQLRTHYNLILGIYVN
jgi:hypothetical protein